MIHLPIFNIKDTEQIATATFFQLFNKEQCERIIQLGLQGVSEEATIAGEIKDKRRSALVYPIGMDDNNEDIYRIIADRVARYNQFGFQFDVSGLSHSLQLLEYNEGDHYDWHIDIGPGEAAHRKLSVIVQLSSPDDYEGGEVIFKASEVERELPKDQGQLAVFPSYILHKVNPVTKGKRYALVTWAMSQRRFK
jgi:PKHD-type hydroxylase